MARLSRPAKFLSPIEGRQVLELVFDALPAGMGIDNQTALQQADGDDQLAAAILHQPVPVTAGDRQSALGI
jgi:hypothetical protein